jgi:hypothetical protein
MEQRWLAQRLASTVVVTDMAATLTERPIRFVLSPKHPVHLTPHVLILLNISKIIDLSSLDFRHMAMRHIASAGGVTRIWQVVGTRHDPTELERAVRCGSQV